MPLTQTHDDMPLTQTHDDFSVTLTVHYYYDQLAALRPSLTRSESGLGLGSGLKGGAYLHTRHINNPSLPLDGIGHSIA